MPVLLVTLATLVGAPGVQAIEHGGAMPAWFDSQRESRDIEGPFSLRDSRGEERYDRPWDERGMMGERDRGDRDNNGRPDAPCDMEMPRPRMDAGRNYPNFDKRREPSHFGGGNAFPFPKFPKDSHHGSGPRGGGNDSHGGYGYPGGPSRPYPDCPPCNSTTTPPSENPEAFALAIEQKIFALLNEERSAQNVPTLAGDGSLAGVARNHSTDMETRNFFSHTNPDNCDPACRLAHANYTYRSVAENIYMVSGAGDSAADVAERIVDGWMSSSGHRANILDDDFTKGGVGVKVEGSRVYATSLFVLP